MNIINLKLKTLFTNNNLKLIGFLCIEDRETKIDRNKLKLLVNEKEYDIIFPFKRTKSIRFIAILSNFYIVKIPLEDLITGEIHNKPFFIYKYEDDNMEKWSLRYSLLGKKGQYLNSKVKILTDKNTSIYVRQSQKNRLIITVREINKTDYLKERIKINLACFIAKFIPKTKIILYEKHAERYEESASILFEQLINRNYKNIYYIINRDNEKLENIENKYKRHMIYKYTFKHYLTFFSAKTLIGTESPGHAIELRIANKHAARRIYKGKFKYVFLQHGVMYMVSLDSKGRSFFRKDGGMPKNSKIVVSSKLEAKHFVKLAGFTREDLYITGLPKYDKNTWNNDADKIVIMLTWRPWEYNILRNDVYNSPYYKTLSKIIESIPKEFEDKIILMPHPLTLESFKESKLSKYILDEFIYDDVLKNTKVLITDYSSIAYDAFYRGSNVIFYWEDKDFCMEQYGGHLMLNEKNAFGPICLNEEQLTSIIYEQYVNNQKAKYKKRYKKIVEFDDNKNTERLINLLKKDEVI